MANWMYQQSVPEANPPELGATNNGAVGDAAAPRNTTSPDQRHSSNAAPRIRRRNRLIMSCLECRRRKLKCDRLAPCTNCTRFQRDCLYLAPSLDPASQQKLASIKEKMGALERNLEREVAEQNAKSPSCPANATPRGSTSFDAEEDDDELVPEDEEALRPPPNISLDNAYGEGADDEFVDLGVQLGKMRISERIGGWIWPRVSDELDSTLKGEKAGVQNPNRFPKELPSLPTERAEGAHISHKSYIGPGPDYIAPSSSFFFPGTNMNTSLFDYLPSKKAADQLITQYFSAVHYVCRTVHRPTFEASYATFWSQITTGTEPWPCRQAVVFAALFSAAISMTNEQVLQQFGTLKSELVDSLRSGTEYALCKANLLRTTKFAVMQAFVMYLVPQIRGEVSRAHSALVGTAIRLAECMGLHRDGTTYGMTPVEIHVRRLVWHQLLFLDMRTCEGTGPRLQIRRDDYDTQFPWNVDDSELLDTKTHPVDKPYWTDATFARIRAEVTSLRRQLWFDIVQIDKRKKSLTSALVKIQKTRADFTARFTPLIDESIPLQAFAMRVMKLYLHGVFIQVLHRYLFGTSRPMPDRLRQVLIESGLGSMDEAIQIETRPELAEWAWYKGAFHQFHVALLLLVEVHTFPMRKEAPRIWKCLDYIFELPPHLTAKQKGELVLTDLRDRMLVYQQMRKLRLSEMEDEVSEREKREQRRNSGSENLSPTTADATRASSMGFVPPPVNLKPLPVAFSPPPARSGSVTGSSTNGAEKVANDVHMMEDIDWAEWDKHFPIESNSGELNMPDADFSKFTGGYPNMPVLLTDFGTATMDLMNMPPPPSAQDLADVTFTPTNFVKMPGQAGNASSQRNRAYPGSWMGV